MEQIQDLLRAKNISFTVSGPDYLVKCLNPEHEDSNPSMRIDKTTGIFNCFSCGFKGNIFKYFGILTNNTSLRVAKLKEKLRNIRLDTEGLELPEGATPVTQEYRGISKQTLKKFNAFYTDLVTELVDRICFPITDISGKIRVFICRHTLSQGNPRYVIYPRGVTVPVFPPVLETPSKSIVLVEGIFDFLNCYDKGLTNTVCVFGTNSLKAGMHSKLLPFKAQGVTKIYIMFDGDDAGREAAKEIKDLISQTDFDVEIISLADNTDPGELDQEFIDSIREYVNA